MGKKDKDTDLDNPTSESPKLRAMALYNDEIEIGSFICNWDYTDRELARLLFLAEVPTDRKGDDLIGVQFNVRYWICTKIEIPDRQAGGVTSVVRTVLIDDEDQTLSTLSHGIVRSVDLMRKMFGDAPYEPAIPMVVKGASTGTGSDMLMLVPMAIDHK